MFDVTKTFLTGLLAGLTITERTSVRFAAGKAYGNYRVEACAAADYLPDHWEEERLLAEMTEAYRLR
jgi:hypothetical protein